MTGSSPYGARLRLPYDLKYRIRYVRYVTHRPVTEVLLRKWRYFVLIFCTNQKTAGTYHAQQQHSMFRVLHPYYLCAASFLNTCVVRSMFRDTKPLQNRTRVIGVPSHRGLQHNGSPAAEQVSTECAMFDAPTAPVLHIISHPRTSASSFHALCVSETGFEPEPPLGLFCLFFQN